MNKAIVTILSNVESRNIMTKNGAKTVYSQKGSVETEAMRIQVDVEVDGPNLGHRVGQVLEWDLAADLVPGQYGRLELARRMTLVPVEAAKAAPVAAVK